MGTSTGKTTEEGNKEAAIHEMLQYRIDKLEDMFTGALFQINKQLKELTELANGRAAAKGSGKEPAVVETTTPSPTHTSSHHPSLFMEAAIVVHSDDGLVTHSSAADSSSAAEEPKSKNALKRELKMKQKEEERRLKEEEKKKKKAADLPSATTSQKAQLAVEDDLDPTQYYENRLKYIATQKANGVNPYPYKFTETLSTLEYLKKYDELGKGKDRKDVTESFAGRILNIRAASSKLFFYDLDGGSKVQVVAEAGNSELGEAEFTEFHDDVKRGDIVGVTGFPGRTKRGELSIFAKKIICLLPSLCMIPRNKPVLGKGISDKNDGKTIAKAWSAGKARNLESYVLKDQETRYRQRYLDLMLNEEVRNIFYTRGKIVSYIRKFLDDRDFLEAETPMMNPIAGGTAAKPFVTHHNELNTRLYMRIAPELYLKQLIVGGYKCVYEIGKQFRNEGIDLSHNPEFTTCEFYMVYADYEDLMKLTKKLLSEMVKELTGGYKIKYHANGYENDPIEIDFSPPFSRIDMIEVLKAHAKLSIPEDLASEEAHKCLVEACEKFEVKCPPPQTTTRLLDKLVGHFLEEQCVNPTFIINHPEIMSPLAKGYRSKPGFAERFELFVNKFEIANAYTELNDPVVQREQFAQQLKDRQSGDDEAMAFDESFCKALDYGMPPTAGCGLGIDRLAMLLTDSLNIKEVILFPAMRPQDEPL